MMLRAWDVLRIRIKEMVMELHEYAIWKVRVKNTERRYAQNGHDMDFAGNAIVEQALSIVAPRGLLGRALLHVHLDETFRVREKLPGTTKTWEFLCEPVEERLNGIIRYEDSRVGRM
jgi:hypothetical protein